MAHTPGEWISNGFINGVWSVMAGTETVGVFRGPDAADNARLCSAAPDLLASLREALDCLIWDSRDQELQRALAAIAKATGQPTIKRI